MKKKLNKFEILLLLPVLLFIFVFGWIMYWSDDLTSMQKRVNEPIYFTVARATHMEAVA